MTEKKLAKCKRAVQALRAGKGEFVTAERACDEARQAGVPHPVITSVWSEGMPGGLGVLPRVGMKTTGQLSHEVAALLKAETTDVNRFASMALAQDIMAVHDVTRDQLMRETLRSWVGKLQDKYQRDGLGAAPTEADPFGSYLGFPIKTLNSFTTPYYYAEGPPPLGSIAHFQSVRQLKSYMNRMVKAGKLVPRDATDLAGLGFPEEDHQELAEMMRGGAQGSEAMAEHALAAGDCATAFEALLELYAQTARANAHGAAGSNYTPLSTNIQLASLFKRKCMNVR